MDTRKNASLTRHYTIWLDTEGTVSTAQQIVMVQTVNDAKTITTCDQTVIVSIVIVIQLVHDRCNVMQRENVSANQV